MPADTVAWLGSEPFRVLFPAGILASLCGVALWPVFYAGWLDFYPGMAHARLMTLGFAGAFVFGFMGTAMPRMLSAPRLTPTELGLLLAGLVTMAGFLLCGEIYAGDLSFLCLCGGFVLMMGWRWLFRRKEHPPAAFVFAFAGPVLACAGSAILVGSATVFPGIGVFRFAQLLCYQGFLLFPILGVGAFLMPRMLRQEGKATRPWVASAAGLLLIASFAAEAAGYVRSGFGLRLAAIAGYLTLETSVFRRTKTPGTLAMALRVATFSILAGQALGMAWPHLGIGMEHVAFVSGFGLLALTVAGRVALGHAGEGDRFFLRLRPLRWIVGLLLVAMSTRAVAEAIPKIMVSHHIYAALLWIVAALVWLVWVAPLLRQRDPDDR